MNKIMSYSKISGLRSMQHIKGIEREIAEAYRKELPHDVWGNSERFKEWASEKVDYLGYGDYPSKLIEPDLLFEGRYNGVKKWYELIKTNSLTSDNPFLQLKIMRFVTDNLKPDNKSLAPIINNKVFADAVFMVKKYGVSFKKTYNKLMKLFDTGLDVKTENVLIDDIRGKWFNIRVPNWAEADRNPAKFNKVKDFISILSQGSNWCTRTPKTVGKEFSGCTFDIFVDDKGIPQLCLTRLENSENWFRFIRGNDQYSPIPDKLKPVLKMFFEKRGLEDAVVGSQTENKPVKSLFI